MKPYFPEKMDFESPDGRLRLGLTKDDRKGTFERDGKKYEVPGEVRYPSTALLSSRSNLAFLLGSHGDAGYRLGYVLILGGDGKVIRELDLRDHLPELEALSRDYSEHGNFEWITGTSLLNDDRSVAIEICEKKKAVIHADDRPPEISKLR
jgi:hypothetical protein